jgi:hypothetical protein
MSQVSVEVSERMAIDSPAILDMEASGFGKASYPIEVGYVLPDGQSYCTLIRPLDNWTHWDPAAEALHGISRSTALAHGRPVADVVRHLNHHLHGRTVYSDGWAHDYSWLAALFDAADRQPSFRLDNLRAVLTDQEAARWHAAKTEVEQELHLQRHRASADARVLQRTLARVRAAGTELR